MRRPLFLPLLALATLLLHFSAAPAAAQAGAGVGGATKWTTLTGNRPAVVAKGGFSGIFPSSSSFAYQFAALTGLPDVVVWCDVQLTRDGVGLCLPEINLDNGTDIRNYPGLRNTTYLVNGKSVTGWFASDYTFFQLSNLTLLQGIYSRSPFFDQQQLVNSVDYFRTFNTQSVWLNIQHASFYSQQKVNLTSFVLSASSTIDVGYISSPEMSFLRSIAPIFTNTSTKLIYRFLSKDLSDPSVNQTYDSILKNLTFVRTFTSGILIPKDYIWPSTPADFLQPHTTFLAEARNARLEVYVSDFQNDVVIPFNYTYDPISEYLSYVNLGNLSVDGFLTDHPASASAAVGCFAVLNNTSTTNGKPSIISHNGDSGDYPGCTDLAYQNAIRVGADYIECPVRFTKDGFLICLGSVNLMSTTTIAMSPFGTRFSTIPDIQSMSGVFTFNLTWEEIQSSLKPLISNPQFQDYKLLRNPAHANVGNFMSLDDFLKFANRSSDSSLKGVVITIEHAAFLAAKLGFDVVDSVINALKGAGFDKQSRLEVVIQSANSSTLIPFKNGTPYKTLYKVERVISDVDPAALNEIKRFADAVAVRRQSIFPTNWAFVMNQTRVVETLHSANLSVYSFLFMNEFISPSWDFLADPTVEIHNHVAGAMVDGVITDFPETASRYRRQTCSRENYTIPVVEPGLLLSLMIDAFKPSAQAPFTNLTASNVREPPLPPALPIGPSPSGNGGSSGGDGTQAVQGGQHHILPSFTMVATLVTLFLVVP